jgi:glycosyltransferase involved in cell wall biosynthesis
MQYTKSTNIPEPSQKSSDKHPIRILMVMGEMNPGGIETWLMNILRRIDHAKFKIDILVHTTQSCFFDDEIHNLGIRIIPCLLPSKPWLYSRNFKQILYEYGPYDIVHSQVYFFDGFVLRLAAQNKIPTRISHIHPLTDINENQLPRAIYRWIMTTWIAKYATHMLYPSKNTLESFQNICECSDKHTDILHNGVDLELFKRNLSKDTLRHKYGLPANKAIVIYVARFVPHKNHMQMIRIAEKINHDVIKAHFVMVGPPTGLHSSLQKMVYKRNDISIFTGIKDISELLIASDLFFFPSLEEGFGVVAIEASAAGLPIVATNLPTIREACSPSHQTFMFSPNDDEIAVQNILNILENENLKEKLSIDARKWAEKFSINESVGKLTSFYDHCFGTHS